MAVKASIQITISKVIDVYAVYRYYKLQSSTLAKPSKPTANPPSGWSDTEPAYVSGSTNTLYFVDCNVYSDKTFSFSEVSKSSSYEAAKDAWNKAQNAQDTANSKPDMSDVSNYVSSRGDNLITNGTCFLGNNTNFSNFIYDGSDTYGAGGSFKINSKRTASVMCDEYIPVDVAKQYLFSYWIKTSNPAAKYYDFVACYDIDKFIIKACHVKWIPGSTTTLAKELKNGDTVVHLKSTAGFNKTATEYYCRGLIFWNYKNSKGYIYGPEIYSRNVWQSLWSNGTAIDNENNTITLTSPWAHGTFPAGTSVSQCSDGGDYTYLNGNYTVKADTWTEKKGIISGIGKDNEVGKFREGTAFIKIGWLLNYNGTISTTNLLSTISLTQNVGFADVISNVDVEYYLSTSATSLSGGSWSTTAPTWVNGKYMWSRTVTIDGAGNKTYSPSQNGVCIAGAKGDTGTAGKGVKSIVEQYYKSTSATSLSGGSWSTTYPGWENGKYIWTRSVITYTDNTSTTTTAVCVTGAKGSTGATGNGISKIEEYYAVSSSNLTAPTSWSSTVPTMTTTNKYLWNYETITYTSGSTVDTTKRVIGVYGNTGSKGDTGANGKSIGSVINYYLATSASSNVTTGTSGWTTTVQSVSASKKYLWNYEVVKYSDGTTASTTTPCIIGAYGDTGAKGDKGETGATGKGVKSSAVTYQASTSGTTIPTGTWQTTIPSVSAGSFLWTKTTITYTDNTSTTSYSVGKMGNTGSAGKDAITISATAPTSPKTNQLWQTASGKPIKRWDGSKWVLYYVSVENLDVDTLSAITANLGTVTAGVLKSKDDVTKFDVANGVLESFDNETLQTLRLSAGGIKYIGKDASTNQMVSCLTFRGLVVRNINNRYGCSITLDESFDDFTVTKLINNGQGTDTVPLFSSLKQVPVSGTKVLSLTKGTNYVKLFTAAEVAALLGTSSGNADHAMISVANGDAKAFNARVFGAEYWSDSDAWWVYFNSAASITQPVRINYMITRIDQ